MEKGYCHICQKNIDLTFEHIPPNKAFNFTRAKSIEGESMLKLISDKERMPWNTQGLRYVSKQSGMGINSLCGSCNNLTGTNYGNAYIDFAWTIHHLFPEINKKIKNKNPKTICIEKLKVNPLLFAKQVLSMFCSLCPHITKENPEIIDLLLNKEKRGLDTKKYRLTMFLIDKYIIQYSGFQVMHYVGGETKLISTIDAYPFGFVLEFDPKGEVDDLELDITNFFNDYECKEYILNFGIAVLERNNFFPKDYRTRKQFEDIKKTFSS